MKTKTKNRLIAAFAATAVLSAGVGVAVLSNSNNDFATEGLNLRGNYSLAAFAEEAEVSATTITVAGKTVDKTQTMVLNSNDGKGYKLCVTTIDTADLDGLVELNVGYKCGGVQYNGTGSGLTNEVYSSLTITTGSGATTVTPEQMKGSTGFTTPMFVVAEFTAEASATVTLEITGREMTTYERISSSESCVLKEDFSTYKEGDKLPEYDTKTGNGVYMERKVVTGADDTTHYVQVENGKAVMYDSTSVKCETHTVVDFSSVAPTDNLEGCVDISLRASKNSWTAVRWENATGAERFGLRLENNVFKYRIDGGTTQEPDNKVDVANGTEYKIYFKLVAATNTLTVTINDKIIKSEHLTDNVVSLQFSSSDGDAACVDIDNVAVRTISDAELLNEIKENAISVLNKYRTAEFSVNKADYDKAVADGTAAINAAADSAGVTTALADAKAVIDSIESDATIAARELATAKENAIAKLKEAFPAGNYTVEQNAQSYLDAMAVAETAINEVTDIAQIVVPDGAVYADQYAILDAIYTNEELASITTYNVTINLNYDGCDVPQTYAVESGKTIPEAYIPDTTRSGYKFEGWYSDVACTTAFDITTTPVTGAITLYAKWTATATVIYSYKNSTIEMDSSTDKVVYHGSRTTNSTISANTHVSTDDLTKYGYATTDKAILITSNCNTSHYIKINVETGKTYKFYMVCGSTGSGDRTFFLDIEATKTVPSNPISSVVINKKDYALKVMEVEFTATTNAYYLNFTGSNMWIFEMQVTQMG